MKDRKLEREEKEGEDSEGSNERRSSKVMGRFWTDLDKFERKRERLEEKKGQTRTMC